MFRQRKVETVGTVSEFLNGATKKAKIAKRTIPVLPILAAAGTAYGSFGITASASVVDGAIYGRINDAFMPLVELVKGLAYPISLVVLTGGALMILIGKSDEGFKMIRQGCIGYILVNLMPLLMGLLVEIAKAI